MATRREFLLAMSAMGLMAAGCDVGFPSPDGKKADHPGFPYHPLVYHLDLVTLSYHLYGQTLVWPFDPYYEEMSNSKGGRPAFLEKVRVWAREQGEKQKSNPSAMGSYRGPGVLGSFPNNALHDPIVYRYDTIYPWSDCITSPESRWVVYKTPKQITQQIKDVYVAYRKTGKVDNLDDIEGVGFEPLALNPSSDERSPNAKDVLLCFEGGTGDKGEAGQPHSQSIMGYVLMRHKEGKDYDVHVCFRGSRSGSAARALLQALNTSNARGNPDWVTDLGWFLIPPEQGGAVISNVGSVYRGFARSMKFILPQVMRCLKEVAKLAGNVPPQHIYVTGHSLGGGLAQHFVSSVLQGNVYAPEASGTKMPVEVQSWPWKQLKLISFSSPRAGNEEFAKSLTEKHLASRFWSHPIFQADHDAWTVSHPDIVPRLLEKEKPAAFRVLISNDPITTEKVVGGKHVGQTVYADAGRNFLGSFSSHEVGKVRELMTSTLDDDRIPNDRTKRSEYTWQYILRENLYKEMTSQERGSTEEMKARVAIIKKYYESSNITFNANVLEKDLRFYLDLLDS